MFFSDSISSIRRSTNSRYSGDQCDGNSMIGVERAKSPAPLGAGVPGGGGGAGGAA